MAYDASNNQSDQEVTSSTPLTGGAQQPAQSTQTSGAQAPSQPATVQSGMSSTEAGMQPQSTSSKKPASSGMFTNIQKYVQKNKPQAQKMSKAVTENVGGQASEIAQQAEKKQSDMKTSLDANQKMMDQQTDWARGQVQQAMNVGQQPVDQPAPQAPQQPSQPSQQPQPAFGQGLEGDAAQTQFQDLMRGPQGVSEVGGLNIGQQQQKAKALEQLTGQAQTEQGRKGLLQQTFRPEGEYTRGMSGLDQLIVSGDDQARTDMIQGVQQQSQQLQDQIQTISSDANKAKMAQDHAIKNFGADIENLPVEEQNKIMLAVDSQVADAQTQLQEQMSAMEAAATSQFGEAKYANESEFYKDIMKQFNPEWSKAGNRAWQDYKSMEYNLLDKEGSLLDALQDRGIGGYDTSYTPTGTDEYGRKTGGTTRTAFEGDKADYLSKNITFGKGSESYIDDAFKGLLDNASDYGIDVGDYQKKLQDLKTGANRSDVYGWSGHQDGSGTNMYSYDADKFKGITSDLFKDIADAKANTLDRLVQSKYGMDADEFRSGDFLDRAGVATQTQADQMAALQNLMGRETNELTGGTDVKIGTDTDFMNKLKKRLSIK